MFKLNTFTIVIATAVALGTNTSAVRLNLKTDEVICNGAYGGYSCASAPNLPGPPLSEIPTFNPDRLVIGFPNTNNGDSPNCGDCYRLTYITDSGETRFRNVTVVTNSDPTSITMCTTAYRAFTGIIGPLPGSDSVDAVEIPRASCGLRP